MREQLDTEEPTAKAELRFRVTKLCELDISTEGSSSLVTDIVQHASRGGAGLGVAAMIWLGFYSGQVIPGLLAAALFALVVLYTRRRG